MWVTPGGVIYPVKAESSLSSHGPLWWDCWLGFIPGGRRGDTQCCCLKAGVPASTARLLGESRVGQKYRLFWSWSLVMDGCCVFDPWRGFTDQRRVSEQILQRKMTAWFHGWEGWSEVIYGSKRWFFIIFGVIVIIENILTYYQKFRKKKQKSTRKNFKIWEKGITSKKWFLSIFINFSLNMIVCIAF